MNTIGIALVWCLVQVTAVSLLAGGLYLLVRRVRPAAAAPIVFTALVVVAALSLLAFSPWPRWKSAFSPLPPGEGQGLRAELQERTGDGGRHKAESTEPIAGGKLPPEQAEPQMAETIPLDQDDARPSLATVFRQTVAEELSPQVETASWRWPAMVAMAMLAATACGLGWLLLGMAAIRRQRRKSRPVSDQEVLELVDVLRAELTCLRPVEVRKAGDLTTAATIGWRRPVVLLPADWRSWTSEQRRAVLAHEIAHARSHDFLALLLGQLGLVLHFYHPLLHWLTNRLRLEQELAADAAAANISGGQRQYLSTIAELALRAQDRPMSWPARTFLPTQTTFLRRIAMLRDAKLRFEPLSPATRWTTVAAVLLCGLLAAGLRGPGSQRQAAAADRESVVGGESVLAAVADRPDAAKKQAPKTENILANPGAEEGEDYAEHWVQGPPIDGVKYLWDKQNAFEGKASLCIKKSVNNYFPIAQWSQTVKRSGNLPALEVSAQVKAKRAYKAILDVAFLDEEEQPISHKWAAYIGAKNQGDPPANHGWKKYSGTVPIPDGTAKICVALQDYGPGTVWFDDIQARYATAAEETTDRPEVVTHSEAGGTVKELKYDDGKPDGKRSYGGSGEMIRFTLPGNSGTIKGIRIHGSRYGLPQPPREDFLIYVLSSDMSQILFTEKAPYQLFQRGREKWVNVNFKSVHEVPNTFWIVLDFKAHQTKGVYVSYDTSTGGNHSKVGLPGRGKPMYVNFGGDWMIRAVLAGEPPTSQAESKAE